ncbi:MAG: LppU/SCO3897 family protein [Acidimicrobiales bacterium]
MSDSAGGPEGEETSFKGIPWRRDDAGAVAWFDDNRRRWVRWHPGADAPPRPAGWEPTDLAPISSGRRPSWRTGYRLFPVALVIFVLVIGVAQALRSGPSSLANDEAKAAQKLLGRCLVQAGSAGGHPLYQPKAVTCSSPMATVKVVQVVGGTPGSPACPADTTGVSLAYPGVAYPHVECTQPVHPGG